VTWWSGLAMIRIDDLILFTRVAALGSFTAAANEGGIDPVNASAGVRRLEDALGTTLILRSTRNLRLTPEGVRYLPFAQSIVERVNDSARELLVTEDTVGGTIRLGVPSDLGRNLLTEWLAEFKATHPAVHLELRVGDDAMDIYREPIDAAIRYDGGGEANHVALPLLSSHRRVLVASPAYLHHHGTPVNLGALATRSCLVDVIAGRPQRRWRFPDATSAIDVTEHRSSDDSEMVRQWALSGDGIAYKPWLEVARDVHAGRLTVVLPAEPTEHVRLSVACANRHQVTPALRELHRWLAARCVAFLNDFPIPDQDAYA
jgi:DNA-binding transcriptional LysR family regulator